jgi:hypothetical protein
MSAIIFNLKEEHIKLLKNLNWSVGPDKVIKAVKSDEDGDYPPFCEDSIYEAIDLILNGKPENIDILSSSSPNEYTKEQIEEWDKLYQELPTALDIVLYCGKFETGTYKAKHYIRDWKKVN